ncbi:hypothetical protein P154DRAFT_350636 [Amniculicola lignicola CBS 123094]|uniref:Uncharacterized protein n=1 Tax=Amniculicola lignicola CBS 123094 TaxID=1392246 RepID=A0A6A5VZS3_9PLEO|nr:hypothetical protein P154DRAFT_350636 [Amniculicola lignicola CBS 123094]
MSYGEEASIQDCWRPNTPTLILSRFSSCFPIKYLGRTRKPRRRWVYPQNTALALKRPPKDDAKVIEEGLVDWISSYSTTSFLSRTRCPSRSYSATSGKFLASSRPASHVPSVILYVGHQGSQLPPPAITLSQDSQFGPVLVHKFVDWLRSGNYILYRAEKQAELLYVDSCQAWNLESLFNKHIRFYSFAKSIESYL